MSKILIIDDDKHVTKMLKKLFESNGYEVMDARNGSQGIKSFNENNPDLIITDLIMPEKEGLETIMEIRKINPDIKIIAISGGGLITPEIYLSVAKKLGADYSFVKPLDSDALVSAVKKILAE